MVAAVAITRKDYTAEQLRELAKRTKDAGAARRMLALALVLEGKSRSEAATSCGMDRQILCDWAHRYNAAGIAGLYNRTADCLPSRKRKWPSWFETGRIWSSMVWFAGAASISHG
jgi:hypothetical protein